MNGINRRGQKVVCVYEIEIETPSGRVYDGPAPKLDDVYTVADFLDTGMILSGGDGEGPGLPGIALREIGCIRGRVAATKEYVDLGWPILMFRPLDERKTDISDIIRNDGRFDKELAEEWLDHTIQDELRKLVERA